MKFSFSRAAMMSCALGLAAGVAHADSYSDTIGVFKHAGQSAEFFRNSYGYAVFPTIGQAGFVAGAAHGQGRVYAHGRLVGDTAVTQLSVGFQAGGKAYSEIIFFEDKRAFDEFRSGNFEFGAGASVTAITAGASASVGTSGVDGSASGGQHDAATMGSYNKGMAVFTVAKGGLMYDASIEGEKFSYRPRGES
jgi:lipid-binding SYLF domain-containing protein